MNCTVYSLLKTKRQIKKQTKRQIYIPLWTRMGYKESSEDGKTFTRCYTTALKFSDEFNVNSVFLYFPSYWSKKIDIFTSKMWRKKQ